MKLRKTVTEKPLQGGEEYPGKGVLFTIPQASPGQLEGVAAQLSQGFGGLPSSHLAYLDNIYSPMAALSFPLPSSAFPEEPREDDKDDDGNDKPSTDPGKPPTKLSLPDLLGYRPWGR